MRTRRLGGYLAGAVGAVVVLAGLFFLVGGRRILDALVAADPVLVAATLALGLCWLFAWSVMLRTILGALEVDIPIGKSFFVYAGAVFANNVTPFAQAGGGPVAALLISKISDARYEAGLVGIASVEVVNVVPSISLVFVGIGYYATYSAVGQRLLTAVGTAVILVLVVSLAMGLVWRYRRVLIVRTSGAIARILALLRPKRIDATAVERDVADRMTRFFDHIEQVATDPRRLGVVMGLSLLGWLFQSASLLAAFAAVGFEVPVSVALFVIPLANLAGVAPLPGGLGGIEAAFVALLLASTPIPAPAITAAVLIYRAAIYWVPVVIGGGSVMVIGVRTSG